jgi:predicted RNA-binding protein
MAFWLCILNRENFETIKKEHVWGVAERHKKQLSKSMPGELCAFYLIAEGAGDSRKEPVIGGIAEIASEPYQDLSDIFPSKRNPSEVYAYRVGLKSIKIFEPYVPFKPLIPHLNFITNKKNYSGHLLGKAMREIPKEDMRQILETQS